VEEAFIITKTVRDAILNYLMGRPYAEVAKGVEMLQNLPSVPSVPPVPVAKE
jgi:hypothetical protein